MIPSPFTSKDERGHQAIVPAERLGRDSSCPCREHNLVSGRVAFRNVPGRGAGSDSREMRGHWLRFPRLGCPCRKTIVVSRFSVGTSRPIPKEGYGDFSPYLLIFFLCTSRPIPKEGYGDYGINLARDPPVPQDLYPSIHLPPYPAVVFITTSE